jgi:hypothetical protein
MSKALTTEVPIVSAYDYEGCVTLDAKVRVMGQDISMRDIIPLYLQENPPAFEGPILGEYAIADTLGGTVPAQLHYGGRQACQCVLTESGHSLEGSKHPFMVQLPDGCLAWKMLEELEVEDIIFIL